MVKVNYIRETRFKTIGDMSKSIDQSLVTGNIIYPTIRDEDGIYSVANTTKHVGVSEISTIKDMVTNDYDYYKIYDPVNKRFHVVRKKMSKQLETLITAYVTRIPLDSEHDGVYDSILFSDGKDVFYFNSEAQLLKVSGMYTLEKPKELRKHGTSSNTKYRGLSLNETYMYLHQLVLLLKADGGISFDNYVSSQTTVINHIMTTNAEDDVNSIYTGERVPSYGYDNDPHFLEVISQSDNVLLGKLSNMYCLNNIPVYATGINVPLILSYLDLEVPELMGMNERDFVIYMFDKKDFSFDQKTTFIQAELIKAGIIE